MTDQALALEPEALAIDAPPSLAARKVVQLDLFLPFPNYSEVPLRDSQELMQRPFFSLAKTKRIKPINYVSPDGKVTIEVTANAAYGMATIWDSDLLIAFASIINDMQKSKKNDISRVIKVHPSDILRRIGWGLGGRAYERLTQALDRLKSTTIKTNVRNVNRRETVFSWVAEYTHLIDERNNKSLGMEIELSNWFFEGVVDQSNLLAINPDYFRIKSGTGKWLYRVARKHAGGNGAKGFTIGLDTLHAKSGSERSFKAFKKAINDMVRDNDLPDIHLEMLDKDGLRPKLHMVMREHVAPSADMAMLGGTHIPVSPKKFSKQEAADARRQRGYVTADSVIDPVIMADIRQNWPGWDYNELLKLFDQMLEIHPEELPVNYSIRFRGFVKSHHERNKHIVFG